MKPHKHVNNIPPHQACNWCRGCVVGMCMALAGCSSVPSLEEPLNLSKAKEAVVRYQDSGAYDRDLAATAGKAIQWLEARAAARKPSEKLALVMDIDETVLSNASLMRRLDYAFIPDEWDRWLNSAAAPAIVPVREVYTKARALGVDVFFVTGRRDPKDREATAENLRRQGMGDYVELILAQPSEKKQRTDARKAAARARIEAAGWAIIANIGDQESDLRGGHSERTFKLENPFYLME